MYVNNIEQLNSFIIFMLTGILISIIFDLFRVSRKIFKTPDAITYIEDTLFWVIAGILILYSIFVFNNGELRLYIFIGILVGILLYMIFISKYFIKVNVTVLNFIKRIFNKFINLLLKPFKFIFSTLKKILFKPVSFICINLRKIMTILLKKINKIKIIDKKLNKNKGISKNL